VLPGLFPDVDATVVVAHSEKEQAAPDLPGSLGFHPVQVFSDNTGKALAGVVRAGNAGAKHCADHVAVTDLALAYPRPAPPRHPASDPRRRCRMLPRLADPPDQTIGDRSTALRGGRATHLPLGSPAATAAVSR
jgi:hypothetical protein